MRPISNFIAIFILTASMNLAAVAQSTSFKFTIGHGKVPPGYTQVTENTLFSEQTGYGIDFDTKLNTVDPFFFSVKVPEGNYKVAVTMGDAKERTETTIKAEARRLMQENVITKAGEFVTKTFIVNVHQPEISTGGRVGITDREEKGLNWDNKLTLEFNGRRPGIATIGITKVEDQITVYLAGNSTVVDQGREPWGSWGQMFPRFFKPGVAIANYAESGLTLSSFKKQRRLQKIISLIKPGDYLFIEFGHNDQKMNGPNDGAWKSYTDNLKYYISEVKKKQAIPVIVTSTSRRRFDENGKTINTLGDFPAAAKKVAEEEQVTVIDLNSMTAILYDALGVEPSKKALVHFPANTFPGQDKALADNTHFSSYGAYELAKCIVAGIQQSNLELKKYLLDLPLFSPAKPDPFEKFDVPPTPGVELVKPAGS